MAGFSGCGAGGPAGESDELSALRAQVEALEARVEALEVHAEAASESPERSPEPAAAGERPAFVHWTFDVTPLGAEITIDGDLVENRRWRGPADGRAHRVRIRRAGFRVVEQSVTADRDRRLHFALQPGRGIQHLPSPPSLQF